VGRHQSDRPPAVRRRHRRPRTRRVQEARCRAEGRRPGAVHVRPSPPPVRHPQRAGAQRRQDVPVPRLPRRRPPAPHHRMGPEVPRRALDRRPTHRLRKRPPPQRNTPHRSRHTSNIVTALGYMAPPDLVHLFLDNAWLDWGRGAECLTYLPGTVIEHMHPAAGKAANDAGYLEANSQTRFTADRDAYEQYTATQLADDIKKLEALKE